MTLLTAVTLLVLIIALALWGNACGDTIAELLFPLTILIIGGVVLWSG